MKTYNLADETNQIVNSDDHPIFVGREGNNKEYLIVKEGKFIAYDTDKGYKKEDPEGSYRVDKNGDKVDEDGNIIGGYATVWDDSGEPDPVAKKAEEAAEETEEEVAEEPRNAAEKRVRAKETEEVS